MTSATMQSTLSKERMEQRTKIDIFEAAFRKIKEATGGPLRWQFVH